MEDVKFKVYDSELGIMHEGCSLFTLTNCIGREDSYYKKDSTVFIQYTGLKSSDGGCGLPIIDLYFGDIIQFYNTDGIEFRAEVIWYKEEECIGFRRLTDGFVLTQNMFNNSGYFQPSKINFQIIGNIYQNPELIIKK